MIKELDSLKGLVTETDTVLFNGDTLEQKYEDAPSHIDSPLPSFEEFSAQLADWNANPVFITGNHDPNISDIHYGELNCGQILITHGDGIFKSIAPWSTTSRILEEVAQTNFERIQSQGQITFYRFLQSIKDACMEGHALTKDYDPTVWGKIQIFAHQAWPPTKPFKILKCWEDAPKLAVEMASQYEKTPQFMIIGHTHKPSIRAEGPTQVINTGSFFPWPGSTAVDLDSNGITIRKVVKRRSQFALGKTVGRFEIDIDLDSMVFPVEGEIGIATPNHHNASVYSSVPLQDRPSKIAK